MPECAFKIQRVGSLLLLILASTCINAESILEVVPVYNRPASEIQPLLMPLLENTDQIVANGDNLIVKTIPERLQAVTKLIRKLDIPLNNLQITVIQSRDVTAAQLNAGMGVSLNIPLSNPAEASGSARGYFNQSQGRNNIRYTQTIRTLEGTPAQIKVGNAVPVITYQSYGDGYGYSYGNRSTQYLEATTGFEVTPRLTGRQVTLDVSPWSDRFDAYGRILTQAADTSIRANLGEWIEIGNIEESGQNFSNGAFSSNQQSTQNRLRILVKVDLVN